MTQNTRLSIVISYNFIALCIKIPVLLYNTQNFSYWIPFIDAKNSNVFKSKNIWIFAPKINNSLDFRLLSKFCLHFILKSAVGGDMLWWKNITLVVQNLQRSPWEKMVYKNRGRLRPLTLLMIMTQYKLLCENRKMLTFWHFITFLSRFEFWHKRAQQGNISIFNP